MGKEQVKKEDILEKTIKERKKLPKEVKENIMQAIFVNTSMIILMTMIVAIVNITFCKFNLKDFSNYLKFIQMSVCGITIGFFEYSYRKDSFIKSIYGIEFAVFSVAVLYVKYMYILNSRINFLINILILFIIYYFVKSVLEGVIIRTKYLKANISDVKEIVKNEKKGYIDEESKKTLKEKKKMSQKKRGA